MKFLNYININILHKKACDRSELFFEFNNFI